MKAARFIVSLTIIAMYSSCASGINNQSSSGTIGMSTSQLSSIEIEGLIQIREEEKLAGDVYLALYEKWNLRPFSNIEKSERTHMNAIKSLLDKFSIEDPVKSMTPGFFQSPLMQKLYNDLVEKGMKSLNDALTVAAEIEELDIADIQDFLEKTSNEDIKVTYQNLLKGSRNHLRAFNRQLENRRISYSPVHISKESYDKIVSSKNEAGAISDPDYKF